jgi:hypothetical protein
MKQTTGTKAKVPAKPQKMSYLGALATEEKPTLVADNMETKKSDLFTDLNFKVLPDFKLKYKVTASSAGMSMKELLEESFDMWLKSREGK